VQNPGTKNENLQVKKVLGHKFTGNQFYRESSATHSGEYDVMMVFYFLVLLNYPWKK
jgi:hypothetical protein